MAHGLHHTSPSLASLRCLWPRCIGVLDGCRRARPLLREALYESVTQAVGRDPEFAKGHTKASSDVFFESSHCIRERKDSRDFRKSRLNPALALFRSLRELRWRDLGAIVHVVG